MSAEFSVQPSAHPLAGGERNAILADPGFGRYFTDHMALANWAVDQGWHDHRITALEPFSLHPSAAVFHYAQEILEGLKAYRHASGDIYLFRPEMNARRFARSAKRLALPELDEKTFLRSIELLVRADESWVSAGECLYLRPFMFASEEFLGVRPAARVTYSVIASPAGAYFDGSGVTLWISDNFTRAAVGGTGAAKCGGNYAGSLAAQLEARQHNCDQVLFLDSVDRNKLEESGAMNIGLITADRQLITPGLGTILDGITRDSVLTLAAEHGLTPVERPIELDELRTGCTEGTITEVFGMGTAAALSPIVGFRGSEFELTVGTGEAGKTTMALREHLLDIQFGRAEDQYGWLHRVT